MIKRTLKRFSFCDFFACVISTPYTTRLQISQSQKLKNAFKDFFGALPIKWRFFCSMKKIYLTILILFVLSSSVFSQGELLLGIGGKYKKIKKDIYDTALVSAYYKLAYLKDSTRTSSYTKGLTVLSFSDKYVRFGDYYRLLADSVNDMCAEDKKKARDESLNVEHSNYISKTAFYTATMTDLENRQTTVQIDILLKYEYTMPTPDLRWILESGDTLINGVACKKATCNYAGRHYIAWYDENFPVPYGPYIFYGLPGLIMKIYDDKRNWIFENVGIEKAEKMKDMYLYKNKKIIKTSREHALAAYKNETENMLLAAIESGRIKFIKKGSRFNDMMKRRPSNMIEQEW